MGLDSSRATPAAASLAPAFQFHPTDEELVWYYLKRKVCGRSRLKSRDLEWYFFSVLDMKYGNGSKTNRATERGYWKTTGKDWPVMNRSRTVGMKKTLIFHSGWAPHGGRTNWVMHEYKLADKVFKKAGIVLEWEDDELITVLGRRKQSRCQLVKMTILMLTLMNMTLSSFATLHCIACSLNPPTRQG